MEGFEDIAYDLHGRLPILHILAPHSTRYFNPASLKLLEPTLIPDPKDNTQLIPSRYIHSSLWYNFQSLITNFYEIQ